MQALLDYDWLHGAAGGGAKRGLGIAPPPPGGRACPAVPTARLPRVRLRRPPLRAPPAAVLPGHGAPAVLKDAAERLRQVAALMEYQRARGAAV